MNYQTAKKFYAQLANCTRSEILLYTSVESAKNTEHTSNKPMRTILADNYAIVTTPRIAESLSKLGYQYA